MKNNQPVTQNEISFPASQRLISATNAKGVITYCNDEFVAVSDFAREDLIGSPHNTCATRICPRRCSRICGPT